MIAFKRYGWILPITCILSISCGRDYKKIKGDESSKVEKIFLDDKNNKKIIGEWKFTISENLAGGFQLKSNDFQVSPETRVPHHVSFEVSTEDFYTPYNPLDGLVSFGKIRVDKLRDNQLKVCGDSGKEKCNFAALRIYTDNTPGPGYWNIEENYGLPLYINDFVEIPHQSGQALEIGKVDLSEVRVLKKSHFEETALSYSVFVDFFDSVAGLYRTNIVVQYILY